MSKKEKSQRNFIFIVIVIISVIGISYLLTNANTMQSQKNDISASVIPTSAIQSDNQENVGGGEINLDNQKLKYQGKLVYTDQENDVKNIYTKFFAENAKIVFTDKDETEKIKAFGGITSDAKILALMSPVEQVFGGSLYLIKTDGSGEKEKIIDEFASPQTPAISPDTKSIAYVLFSNTEKDYGFTLYVMNELGQNKLEIDHDKAGIMNLTWSEDSKNIAYTKGNNPNMKILIADNDAKNQEGVYDVPKTKTISGLSWCGQNNLVITLTKIEKITDSEIIVLDTKNKKTTSKIEDNERSLSNAICNDTNMETFTYRATKDLDENMEFDISISNINNDVQNIQKARQIIGWIK